MSNVVDKKIKRILLEKMTRKQFLLFLGLGFLALTRISGLLKKFSDPNLFNSNSKPELGFGSNSYGGKEKV